MGSLESAVTGAIIGLVVIAFMVGGLVVWLSPIIWHWIKPFIHMMTA